MTAPTASAFERLFPDAEVHLLKVERKVRTRSLVSKAKIKRMIDAVGRPATRVTIAQDGGVEIGFGEDDVMARTGDEIIL